MDQYLINCLRILRTEKIGPVTYNLLKQKYKTFDNIINHLECCNIPIISHEEAQEELENHKKNNCILLEKDMDDYPIKLKTYSKLFPLISIKGNPSIINGKTIGIVGSRQCSIVGKEYTKFLTKNLRKTFITVSGLAQGIDTIVAENSIDGHIGVIAGGINKIYPESNHNLYKTLTENGSSCVISCQPWNMDPKKNLFPIRNQLISALSDGLIITEAKEKSGSLQTAQYILNYNKPLMVVPGHPFDDNYSGNNQLLKNKQSIPLYDNIDIEKILSSNSFSVHDENYWDSAASTIDINNIDGNLLKEIESMVCLTPLDMNHLSHYLNHSVGAILSCCILLEIKGKIIINPNMTIIKAINNKFFMEDE
jgi:DNA processing protein